MLPILKICADDRKYRTYEMENKLAEWFSVTEEEKNRLLPSGKQTTLYNRTTWAMFELMHAGLLARENKTYTITPDGKNMLQKGLSKIDRKFLMSIPKYAEWTKSRRQDTSENESDDLKTPLEMVEAGYKTNKQSVEEQILEKINDCPPEFFERLVVKLMRRLGYGIDDQITAKPGDGGIDGVILEDKLGFSAIYLQAKRWKTTVPIDVVRSFGGSLAIQKSQKGVLITTSSFPKSAYDHVKQASYKIVLIDGQMLAEYMYECNLGVVLEDSYDIKKLDESFFE